MKEFENAGIRTLKPYICEETANQTMKFGNFTIKAFANRTPDGKWLHNNSDGSECPCYGFWIYHPDMGKLTYASDTECVVQRFKDLNHILIEANYSQDLVDRGSAKFTHQIRGHMSIDTACDFLKANKSSSLRNVVLCHLSGDCGDPESFKAKAQRVVHSSVYVARKGLDVDLRLELF